MAQHLAPWSRRRAAADRPSGPGGTSGREAPTFAVRDAVRIALFAALVAALGLVPPIRLPVSPVPITAQTFGVMLAGGVLGARNAAWAMLTFLLLVAAGAPVLAGGRGGLGVLAGPSAGYLLSWPLAAWLIGRLAGRPGAGIARLFAANVLGGILLVYLAGAPVLALLTGRGFREALVGGALLFLPGDLLKAAAAAALSLRLRRAVPRA